MPGCRAWIMIINWAPNTTYRKALSEKVTDKYLRFTIFRENSILIFKNEYLIFVLRINRMAVPNTKTTTAAIVSVVPTIIFRSIACAVLPMMNGRDKIKAITITVVWMILDSSDSATERLLWCLGSHAILPTCSPVRAGVMLPNAMAAKVVSMASVKVMCLTGFMMNRHLSASNNMLNDSKTN